MKKLSELKRGQNFKVQTSYGERFLTVSEILPDCVLCYFHKTKNTIRVVPLDRMVEPVKKIPGIS